MLLVGLLLWGACAVEGRAFGTQALYLGTELWTGCGVTYSTSGASSADLTMLGEGMAMWTNKVPELTFRKRVAETEYAEFVFERDGLYTGVSNRLGARRWRVKIGKYGNAGTVAHEIGHVLGLAHEHQRFDRDQHVKVYTERVREGWEKFFMKGGFDVLGYDLESIMHYGPTATRREGETGNVIDAPGKIGQRSYVSDGDAAAIRFLYTGCTPGATAVGSTVDTGADRPKVVASGTPFTATCLGMGFDGVESEVSQPSPGGQVQWVKKNGDHAHLGGVVFTPSTADWGKTFRFTSTFRGAGREERCTIHIKVGWDDRLCAPDGAVVVASKEVAYQEQLIAALRKDLEMWEADVSRTRNVVSEREDLLAYERSKLDSLSHQMSRLADQINSASGPEIYALLSKARVLQAALTAQASAVRTLELTVPSVQHALETAERGLELARYAESSQVHQIRELYNTLGCSGKRCVRPQTNIFDPSPQCE